MLHFPDLGGCYAVRRHRNEQRRSEDERRTGPGQVVVRPLRDPNELGDKAPTGTSVLTDHSGIRKSSKSSNTNSRKSCGLSTSSTCRPSVLPQTICCLPMRRLVFPHLSRQLPIYKESPDYKRGCRGSHSVPEILPGIRGGVRSVRRF